MSLRLRIVLASVALAVLVALGAAPASTSAGARGDGPRPRPVAQAPVDQPPGGVAEEAPSSIDTGDSVRAFLVLAVCALVIAVPVGITVLRVRRRQRASTDPASG